MTHRNESEANIASHEAERAAFERWYVGDLATHGAREIERDQHGSYILMGARLAWQAYHAGWLREGAA
jgi:hypothetical protein